MDITRYETLVFDCDGVILDSNKVKTEAFFKVARPYGERAATALMEYHKKNGGVSRYRKFEFFLQHIIGTPVGRSELDLLLESYAREIRNGLFTCHVSKGLDSLRVATQSSRWLVVSGGDQSELRDIFCSRNLSRLFDGGVFGSPDSKDVILARELSNSNIKLPALFLGDSQYDYESASRAGLDFVFVSGWTEFSNWREYQSRVSFADVPDLASLLWQSL